MKIREVMTETVELVDPDTVLRDAAQQMREAGTGFLPVGVDDRLVGTLTDRDITVRAVATDWTRRSPAFAKPCPKRWSTASRTRTPARPQR